MQSNSYKKNFYRASRHASFEEVAFPPLQSGEWISYFLTFSYMYAMYYVNFSHAGISSVLPVLNKLTFIDDYSYIYRYIMIVR